MPCACFLTKVLQCCEDVRVRPAPPSRLGQYLPTVRGETRMPSFSESSSATRSSPQVMFSLTIRAMSWRMSLGSGGRPPRDFQRQYSLKALRCQRTKVLGVTTMSASFRSEERRGGKERRSQRSEEP